MGKLGTDLVGTTGNQFTFHQGQAVLCGQHLVIGLAGFGARLHLICDKHPILLFILEKVALQASLPAIGRSFHNGKIALIQFPVLDLLIHDPQRNRSFCGDNDATGVAVNAVAQGDRKSTRELQSR